MNVVLGELKVPGLRAHMGDWVYYTTFLRLKDVAERISLVKEIHTSRLLQELIQREIDESSHSESIKRYLLHQKQRFFNALVVGVYGGSPKWIELSIGGEDTLGLSGLPSYIQGALGILRFDGAEQLFAIDGQHRVVGIKRAITEKPQLADEELTCIFIAHQNDKPGLQRTRRLFTTLNRYAKPVSKMEIIALDEDDVVSIVTRRLVDQYPLFRDWTSIKKGKNIAVGDRKNFTTIVALYDALDRYLQTDSKTWKDFKKLRPSDNKINECYKRAIDLWGSLIANFPPIRDLVASRPEEQRAAKYRNKKGGHLIFRPVGLYMVVVVIKMLMDQGVPLRRAVRAMAHTPQLLTDEPWTGLLWDPTNRRMMVAGERQKVAIRLLYHGLGGSLATFKQTGDELRSEMAGLVGKQPSEIHLRRWARLI